MPTPTPTGTVLDRILEARIREVEHRKKVLPETALKYGVKAATPLRDFSAALLKSGASDEQVIEELFLTTLSRKPNAEAVAVVKKGLAQEKRDEVFRDLFWALLNSKEFAFNH